MYPTEATLRFAFWGSEEQGILGSRYHVKQLGQDQRDRYRAVFQNDMVATSWDPAIVYWLLSFERPRERRNHRSRGVRPAPRLRPPIGRPRTPRLQRPPVVPGSRNRRRQLLWRGELTPASLEPPYHSPEDTIAKNVSLERLQVSMELIGTAAYKLAKKN
jgi:hypothetical protein